MTMKPDDVSRPEPAKPIGGEEGKTGGAPSTPFESYMQKAGEKTPEQKTPGVSPFDLAHGKPPLAAGPTFDSLLGQVKSTQSLLGDVNTSLQTKDLKLKQSQRYLLRNKLSDANAHLRAANVKLGVDPPPPRPPTEGGGIIGKFLDFVADGQSNLQLATQQINNLKAKGDQMKPADFLAVQLKMSHAQQEVEYASIMLSNAVNDIRTLFNIQL